jgi:hypothetical protein
METKTLSTVRWSFGLFLFAFAAFLITFALLEGFVNGLSTGMQRSLLIALIVVPTAFGTLFGIASFLRHPRRLVLSVLATLLNGLSFLYFAFLAGFAG